MQMLRPLHLAALPLLLTLTAGCGGGGGDAAAVFAPTLGTDSAQGYAADAATAPVAAAGGVEAATALLEVAVARRAGAAPAVSLTAPCAGGGSVTWSVAAGSAGLPFDGRLDAGETYQVTYSGCSDGETTTDGSLALAVVANDSAGWDVAVTATSLTSTSPQGRTTIDGSLRQRRSVDALAGGGRHTRSTFTASAVSTTTVNAAGTSRYELRSLDWTVDRSSDAAGATTARSHQGTLLLVASPARRSPTTLQVVTEGAMTVGSDGYADAGSLAVVTADGDRITVGWSPQSAALALDIGNDGRVDLRWTLRRTAFYESAG